MRSMKKLNSINLGRILVLVTAWALGSVSLAFSQGADSGIRTQVQGNSVYVYHTLQVPTGHGFNIYRSQANSEFKKLNEAPITGAGNMAEFMGMIGEYAEPMQKALELNTPQSLYFRLMSSRIAANLATFYYLDVARALGHLYVDSTATIGSNATYRIEVVNENEEVVGQKLEQNVWLTEVKAPQPQGLLAVHEERTVTLKWSYPTSTQNNDDKIVRFNIYDSQDGKLQLINTDPIVRINNFKEFDYIFTTNRSGIILNLIVAPVSLTMKEGPVSEIFTYTLVDDTAPAIITGLEALPNMNGEVELTWPISTEVDALGYNIYRANRIKGDFKKLNKELIPLLANYFVDRPAALQTSYFYRITAVDESGNESEMSNATKADLEDHTQPMAPLSLKAEALENGDVQLTWEEAEKKSNFKTYVLLRKRMGNRAGLGEAQLNVDDFTGTSFVDKGEAGVNFAEGAYYQYKIVAVDSARNVSDTVSTMLQIPDTTPPEPPTNMVTENDDGVRAVLRWNASTSADVGEYLIYKGESPSNMELFHTQPAHERMMRDDSVAVGNIYYYALAARDTLGNESIKTETKELLIRDYTPPRAVRNVRAQAGNDQVSITWEPVNVYDLKGYRIYISSTPSGVYERLNEELITETKFTTANLDLSTWIQVRAVDTSGNESKKSVPVNIYNPAN